jgi:drug/metabolite transporter (DMT)-like permease
MDLPSRTSIMDRPIGDEAEPAPDSSNRVTGMLGGIWNSAWILLVLGNFAWASNIVIGRALLGHVPSVSLSFWRWTGAFVVALGFAWPHLKKDWPVLREHWKIMLALAATGIALFNIAAYIGLSGTTALNVLLMQSSLPLVVTIWAFALLGERPSGWQLAAVMVSVAGVAFVAAHGSPKALLTLQFYRSDLWIAASVIIYGAYTVLLRWRPDVHPLSFMQTVMGLGTLMVAPFYLWELSSGETMTNHWQNFVGIGYMAVFPSFISYLFFNRGVQLIGAARAGQSTHLMPIFGSIMACVCLGESLHLYHLVGVILIGAGIVLAQLKAPVRR